MTLPNIGLTGYIGAGKSTAANELKRAFWDYRIYAFADPLKEIAEQLGWNGKKDERGRQLLRALGAAGREYDPECWTRLAMYGTDPLIFDDVRYPNEAAYIRNRGGIIIEIRRTGVVCDGHPSESQHIEPDYIVNNDSNTVTLAYVLKTLVEMEIHKRKVQL